MTSHATPERLDEEKTFASGRYRVRRVLGEGGQKVVYLVHDAVLDRDCALSLLKPSSLSPEAVERLQREARAMARLQPNPHVVSVYDFGEEAGAPYLVSEYIEAGDLRREIRSRPDGLAMERLIGVASDIADALAASHECGIVHRDVTPGNVWLTSDGRSMLGDFGLAVGGEGAISVDGELVGTAAYMAPEQALGQRCDAKSDLYSLGVVMYEMATGRQPFVGDDPLSVISQHINTVPVAPTWHNPAVPHMLEVLILSLLSKIPEDRPASGSAVCEALNALRASSTHGAIDPAVLNPLQRLSGGVFVGRDAELATLRLAVESAIAGQRQLVLLGGEPGIGKTRLSEQLSTYGKLRRAAVYWGRCFEDDGAPAFWPWIQILRALAESADDATLREDVAEDGGRIAQILPEIGKRLGDEAVQASNPELRRFELFEAIAAWMRRSAQRAPLVLLLEDLHWADEPSVLLLQHLAEALRDARVVIAGTYRDAEIDRQHPLEKVLTGLPRLGNALQLTLRGLSEDDVASYIALATGKPAPPHLAATVYRQTEGNALFVSEIVRMLTASGAIDTRDGSWTQEIPTGVRGVIGRRLGALSDECRGALATAAVIGREFELRVLERVSDAGVDAVLGALDEAMAAQLVTLAPDASRRQGRFVFSHALVRDTLYDELSSSRRLRMHARTAEMLEELYGADPGERISALAFHFRESAMLGDVTKAVDYSIRAGDAARKIYAYEEAARHWDAAIELLGDATRPGEQAVLLERAADLMWMSGVDYARGINYLERALKVWEQCGDRRRLALTHNRLGRAFGTFVGLTDIDRSMVHYETALALLSGEPTSERAGIYLGLAIAQGRALLTDHALGSVRHARLIVEALGPQDILIHVTRQEGMLICNKGRLREGTELQDEAWAMADATDDPIVRFYSAWTRSFREREYRADPRGAISLALREIDQPRVARASIQRNTLLVQLACSFFLCGDRAGLESVDLSSEALGPIPFDFDGRWNESLLVNFAERARARKEGNRAAEGWRAQNAGISLQAMRCVDEAVNLFAEAVGIFRGQDFGGELRSRTLLCIVEAERGNSASAREQLEACDAIVAEGEDWLGQIGRIELARAATLACSGDIGAAEAVFARAIDILRRYELVWDEAEAFRLWGRMLVAFSDQARAMGKFRQAIDVYSRIGAGTPWIARIVQEYAGVGGSSDVTLDG